MKKQFLLLLLLSFLSIPTFAILTPTVDSIPMSDGKKLAADIYIPSGMSTGPVILVQTPYNRLAYRIAGLPLQIGMNLNSSNYIFVILDWRGFYGSAAAAYIGAPNNGKDGYDVVEWLAQQSWCNGKIGTWGPSALGRVQFSTAKNNPPHLTCICPLVAAPQYDYTEYFPNGCLRTEYVEQLDALGFGFKPVLMPNTVHNTLWTFAENANDYPDSIRVPCFMIGGWYDHTIPFMIPFFSELQTQSPVSVQSQHRLLMGPWVHGGHGSAVVGSTTAGQLSYTNANHWSDSLALLFFDYHLRNMANNWNSSPVVQYYQMGENQWHSSSVYPPAGAANVNFYFHQTGLLADYLPANGTDHLFYTYDPNNPSPTVGGCTLRADLNQGPYDQAPAVESRNDILLFTTNALSQDVVLRGNATVHMKVASDKFDTDFNVRLTDVYPDGRSMLVNTGVMRMRFRNGLNATDTAHLTPNAVYDCAIQLPATSITFLTGHKIRVDVSSSNYPQYNRNMNNDVVAMYPGNSYDTLLNEVSAVNTVYTNNNNTSYISMPLVGYVPSGITGIATTGFNFNMNPNPASNQLNIDYLNSDGENASFKICNLLGEMVLTENIHAGNNTIYLKNIPKGIYIVTVNDNSQSQSRKLVVQ